MRSHHLCIPVLLLAMVGCAPGNPGLYISANVAPNDQCEFDVGNNIRSQGVFDVALQPNSYEAVLLLNNQLLNLSQNGMSGYPIMADPNVIITDTVEIELRDLTGSALPLSANPTTVPAGGVAIPTGDGMTPGQALSLVQVIPAAFAAELAPMAGSGTTIVAAMTITGHTLGDAEVVSNEFTLPITLCSRCLVPVLPGEDCTPITDMDGATICAPSCDMGQDDRHIQCSTDLTCVAGG